MKSVQNLLLSLRVFSRPQGSEFRRAGVLDTLLLFTSVVALLWWIGVPLQTMNLLLGIAITELVIVAVPPYFFARGLKLDLVKTFRIRLPSLSGALMMIIIAGAGFFIMAQLQIAFTKLVEIPTSYIEATEDLLLRLTDVGAVVGTLVIVILPAICEELLFRGYILDGLTRSWGAAVGIVISGILFGMFHFDSFRFIPATLMGILFGAIVWQRGSIIYGIIGHIINNGIAFFMAMFGSYYFPELVSEVDFAPLWVTALFVILFVVAFRGIWRETHGSQIAPTRKKLYE